MMKMMITIYINNWITNCNEGTRSAPRMNHMCAILPDIDPFPYPYSPSACCLPVVGSWWSDDLIVVGIESDPRDRNYHNVKFKLNIMRTQRVQIHISLATAAIRSPIHVSLDCECPGIPSVRIIQYYIIKSTCGLCPLQYSCGLIPHGCRDDPFALMACLLGFLCVLIVADMMMIKNFSIPFCVFAAGPEWPEIDIFVVVVQWVVIISSTNKLNSILLLFWTKLTLSQSFRRNGAFGNCFTNSLLTSLGWRNFFTNVRRRKQLILRRKNFHGRIFYFILWEKIKYSHQRNGTDFIKIIVLHFLSHRLIR